MIALYQNALKPRVAALRSTGQARLGGSRQDCRTAYTKVACVRSA